MGIQCKHQSHISLSQNVSLTHLLTMTTPPQTSCGICPILQCLSYITMSSPQCFKVFGQEESTQATWSAAMLICETKSAMLAVLPNYLEQGTYILMAVSKTISFSSKFFSDGYVY